MGLLNLDDDAPKPAKREESPEHKRSGRISLSGVFRSLLKKGDTEKIEAPSESEHGLKLIREAELSLMSTACTPEERVRVLAGLVAFKEGAELPAAATLQMAREACDEITDPVAQAAALLEIAKAERASGQSRPSALAAAKSRLSETWSCGAARVRADLALLEGDCGMDPLPTLKSAKLILEPPASAAEMVATQAELALVEAQLRQDPEGTLKKVDYFLNEERDRDRRVVAELALIGPLTQIGQHERATKIVDRLKALPGEKGAAIGLSAVIARAVAFVKERENEEALQIVEKLPGDLSLADKVRVWSRVAAALYEKDEPELARKILGKARKLYDQHRDKGGLALMVPLDEDAAEAYAIGLASEGVLDEAHAVSATAGSRKTQAQLGVILASARMGAKLVLDAKKRAEAAG